ncbi:GapS4b family protein [Listeria booriae]|uniref:GapS4b family protein n=1 Tax=Listeria booriae TaxID=1552123 RepID=UPI00162628C9|nr:hypothetical protein [Listeria booriae]MBC1290846.1 hypothetical protein [Listeria booriae]
MEENKKELTNVDTLLPSGDSLRTLIASSSHLTDSNLKNLLSQKGIYINPSERSKTVPLILMSLLSPAEFEYLREKQKDKESSIKWRSREVGFEIEENESLLTVFRDLPSLNTGALSAKHTNYEVINLNSFTPIEGDANHLSMGYSIERTDRTKDWVEQQSIHEGEIEVVLSNNRDSLKVIMNHTADETQDVNEEYFKQISSYLLDKQRVGTEAPRKITFEGFNNSSRVKFLLHCLNGEFEETGTLEFKKITYIDIILDKHEVLPDQINWMEGHISNMNFMGESLQETILLADSNNHGALIISNIRAVFKFKTQSSEGECTFDFGFGTKKNKIPRADSEFMFRLVNISKLKNVNAQAVKKTVYSAFDTIKTTAYAMCMENDEEGDAVEV